MKIGGRVIGHEVSSEGFRLILDDFIVYCLPTLYLVNGKDFAAVEFCPKSDFRGQFIKFENENG